MSISRGFLRTIQRVTGTMIAATGTLALVIATGMSETSARVVEVSIPVKGMTCVLCTRGLEEAIQNLSGVSRVNADLSSASAVVEAAPGKSLRIDEIRARVNQAGFEVDGECDLVANGRFEIGPSRKILFRVTATNIVYHVLEGHRFLQLSRRHPGLKGEFRIGFRLHDHRYWSPPGISITRFDLSTASGSAGAP